MPKRVLKGIVVSDKAEKTITVNDEKNKFKIGQLVSIQENKPISKTKKWIVIS